MHSFVNIWRGGISFGGIAIGFDRWRLELCDARLRSKCPFTDEEGEATFEEDSIIIAIGAGFTVALEAVDALNNVEDVDLESVAVDAGSGALEEDA